MEKYQMAFLLVFVVLTIDSCHSDLPKPSYARTVLKVSRSLPSETEELKVRTKEGNMATLIVKRREKSSSLDITNDPPTNFNVSRDAPLKPKNDSINLPNDHVEDKRKDEVRKLEEAQIKEIRARFGAQEERKPEEQIKASARNQTEKPNDSTNQERRDSVERIIDYGNWTPLGGDGRALKLEESTTEEYQNWKPLRTDLKTTTEERTNYGRYNVFPDSLVFARSFHDRNQRNLEPEKNPGVYAFLPQQPRPVRTNIGANLSKNRDAKNVPPEVIVRSEINVKSQPKRSAMSLDVDGTPVIHGRRVPDEPIDKFQTWRNSRVINNKLVSDSAAQESATTSFYSSADTLERQNFERFFKDVNRRYGRDYDVEGRNVYFEWDPKNYKNEALKAEIYEPRNEYRSNGQKRMLHPDGIVNYPTSQIYTPESQKIAPVALKPGARAPVLQYAHPELGVQPAKILKNEKRRPDNFPENQHSFTEQRQKKKYVLNDKNIVDSYTNKDYYPNQHFYGLKRPSDPPFWVKISENLKNQFSTGVEKVSQFTRPVIDPLVEATHKISQNLGLSKTKQAEDKIGTVASGTSILIPALGLVASGAALGIGAVAVGRYLDVDVLKRSNEELEHKRAMDNSPYLRTIQEGGPNVYILENVDLKEQGKTNDGLFLVMEEQKVKDQNDNQENGRITNASHQQDYVETRDTRRRRSLDYLDVFKAEADLKRLVRSKRLQRKGADSISEIVEIDLPVREGEIDVTEFLIPKKKSKKHSGKNRKGKEGTILVIEDGRTPTELLKRELDAKDSDESAMENVAKIVENVIGKSRKKSAEKDRRKRSAESDRELEDVFQNLENAEVAEVAHVDGDWTNTPCAKRIFCDAMIQRGPDASIFMEKKMAALLGLIQPGAAVQVSNHFEEVMNAVRRYDCSRFLCPRARPGNIFL